MTPAEALVQLDHLTQILRQRSQSSRTQQEAGLESNRRTGRPSLRCIAATEDFTCWEERNTERLQAILDSLAGAEDHAPTSATTSTQTAYTTPLTTRSGKTYPARLI